MNRQAVDQIGAARGAAATAWAPWAASLAVLLILTIATGAALWRLRIDTLQSQSRELGLLSLALADELERGLRGTQEGLTALQVELREGRLPLAADDGPAALRTRADLMPLVTQLWILDSQGRVIAASQPLPPPPLASFVHSLQSAPGTQLFLSGPFPSDDQGQMVALALPQDGQRQGSSRWIVASIPARSLLGAFAAATPAGDASMAVLLPDGTRVAVANDPAALLTGEAATPGSRNPGLHRARDGQERLLASRTVAPYGITLLMTRDKQALLAGWRQTAAAASFALVLLFGVSAIAVHFSVLAARRRGEAARAAEMQLARASRLEALGTLAGGVAHDFNSILGAIVGYGEMAREAAVEGSPQARHLDRVLQAAARGKGLVQRIVSFSRGGARTSAPFELEPVIEEVLALLSASLRAGVVLECVLQAPGALVRGDANRAFEAIMNLCNNAIQAMPQGGMLSVRSWRLVLPERQVLSHSSVDAGAYVLVSVSDEGVGISPEVAEHLFEPFFTTRASQSGTGLGLAVVHGVVAEFGGAIDVHGAPGQGARFTLYLPEATGAGLATVPVHPPAVAGRGQRLLVVDDDPALLGMVAEMLETMGYRPVPYTDPVSALDRLKAEAGAFAALITDEVMPHLGGVALAEAAREIAPGLPVLLVSGYGGAALAQRAADAGVSRVLPKPIGRAELARALADLLQ